MYYEQRESEYAHGFPVTAKTFKNISFLAHWHHEIELLLVLEGSMIAGINSEFKLLHKGDIILCPGNSIHSYSGDKTESECLIIVFKPELLENVGEYTSAIQYHALLIDEKLRKNILPQQSLYENILGCFHAIHTEMRGQEDDYKILTIGYLLQLIGALNRLFPKETLKKIGSNSGKKSILLIQKAIKYISGNFTENIQLVDVSDYLGVSTFYFSSTFNKVTGLTFRAYVNMLRIEKANNLILHTNDPIINIAYECGFNSLRTFNRVFKTVRGITPSNLRTPDREME